jgi:hypothetical protein
MQCPSESPPQHLPRTFAPSRRALAILVPLTLAALALAFYLRHVIIQNTPLGLACDAGEQSFVCGVRFITIQLFVRDVFGWLAVAAAAVQLWRPNVLVFGTGLVAAGIGLVLYNNRLSALAVALLVISLARAVPSKAR